MSFFFGNSAVKESLSVEVIKEKLEKYQRIVNEPLDYIEGNYVVLKPEVMELGLVKNTSHSSSSYNSRCYPGLCYILDIDTNQGPVAAAYVFNDRLIIGNIKRNYYRKITCDVVIPEDLERFVNDKPVSKWITPGELVRSRLHYPILDLTSSSMTSAVETFYEPLIVMKNKSGQITISGCSQNDNSIKEHTVEWYTIALYVG